MKAEKGMVTVWEPTNKCLFSSNSTTIWAASSRFHLVVLALGASDMDAPTLCSCPQLHGTMTGTSLRTTRCLCRAVTLRFQSSADPGEWKRTEGARTFCGDRGPAAPHYSQSKCFTGLLRPVEPVEMRREKVRREKVRKYSFEHLQSIKKTEHLQKGRTELIKNWWCCWINSENTWGELLMGLVCETDRV